VPKDEIISNINDGFDTISQNLLTGEREFSNIDDGRSFEPVEDRDRESAAVRGRRGRGRGGRGRGRGRGRSRGSFRGGRRGSL
jgi:hypothetical protein